MNDQTEEAKKKAEALAAKKKSEQDKLTQEENPHVSVSGETAKRAEAAKKERLKKLEESKKELKKEGKFKYIALKNYNDNYGEHKASSGVEKGDFEKLVKRKLVARL